MFVQNNNIAINNPHNFSHFVNNQFSQKSSPYLSKKTSCINAVNSRKSNQEACLVNSLSHPNEIFHKHQDSKLNNTSQALISNLTQTLRTQSNAGYRLSSKRSVPHNFKGEQSSIMINCIINNKNIFDDSSKNCMSLYTNKDNKWNTKLTNEVTKKSQRRRGINIKTLPVDTPKRSSDKKFTLMKLITKTFTKETLNINKPCFCRAKRKIKDIIESDIEAGVMAVLFFIGLFLNDIKTIFLKAKYDIYFDLVYFLLIIILLIEIICSFILLNKYRFSFFFWLDIFSVFSLITDIENIQNVIINIFLTEEERENEGNNNVEKIRTILHLLRVIKLVRAVKVYKAVITLMKSYEIRKKLEEIRNKEVEKLKIKEKKMLSNIIKKRRTNAITTQINNFIGASPIGQLNANNSSENLTTSVQEFSENKYIHHKSVFTVNSVFPVNVPLDTITKNNVNINIKNNTVNSDYSVNVIGNATSSAEAALKQMISNRQKERKKSLQIESRTKKTKVLFLSITKKILVIILFLFFISPILDEDFYNKDKNCNYNFLANYLQHYLENNYKQELIVNLINETTIHPVKHFPILTILYENITLYTNTSINMNENEYRQWELQKTFSLHKSIVIIYSTKHIAIINSYINIVKIFIALIVMFYLSVLINSDLQSLVLKPLEVMLEIVQAVAKDPVNYKSIEDMNKTILKSKANSKKFKKIISTEALNVDYEIQTLQFAILRISALIAIGFGEAGGEILKENIHSVHGLNPMLPGKKIQSVFGFCFIRNFTEINEVLQEKTILFVNTIADIVHSSVDKFNGVCNKNIGDCFLLVWKFKSLNNNTNNDINKNTGNTEKTLPKKISHKCESSDTIKFIKKTNEEELIDKCKSDTKMQLIADSSLVSFLNIIKKIHKSQSILELNKDQDLQERFGKNFKIKMGFGLHIGWGIEGAIGSFYKIDCSYLSPNVNIAARLETATNIYGVDILLSGNLHSCFSEYTQKLCRQIDTVALKGCLFPVKLYTVDLNHNLQPGKLKGKALSGKEKREMINIKRTKIKNLYEKAKIEGNTKSITEIYYKMSKGFRLLLKDIKSGEFKRYFKLGFDEYIRGNWELAYKYLKQANYIEPTDCPTVKLCNYIFSYGKKAPKDWKGFRKLDSKF